MMRNLILCLFAGTLLLGACKEDLDPREEVHDQLVGEWEVESFTVDGVESIGTFIQSFEMEYTKQDAFTGETEWTVIDGVGTTTRQESDYTIEAEGREIDIDGDDLDITIVGDDLTLSGNVDGDRWVIEAERD